ncbi:extracellular solute-binding protein [Longispora sp. NPDC051575]|uniref:sugar ABC transporter substrate-binding protein n=1 Tax=Longispora sp. NPDC051575 TaxID=3154943 RepID=UPI00341D5741
MTLALELPSGDVLALLGLLVTIAAAFIAYVQLRRTPAVPKSAEQADLVHAWWESSAGGVGARVFVGNTSELPIYLPNVTVSHRLHGWTEKHSWPSVAGGARVSAPVRSSVNRLVPGEPRPRSDDYRVRVLFKDDRDRFWLREQGRLERLKPELVVWAERRRVEVLRARIELDFSGMYGIEVRFESGSPGGRFDENVEQLAAQFEAAARAGRTPDVLVGPHDWLGRLAGRGLVEPIVLTGEQRSRFSATALAAMTHNGVLYGVPTDFDTAVLLRNTDLAPDAPATVEELLAHARSINSEVPLALQVGPDGDPYHVWPLVSSAGAALFGQHPDGSWDPSKVMPGDWRGALARLRALGDRGEQVLRNTVDRDRAMRMFVERRTPYLVCASRSLNDVDEVNRDLPSDRQLRIGASPVPGFANGAPARPFTSVYGVYVPKAAPNKALAVDLVGEYLAREDVGLTLAALERRPPVLRSALDTFRPDDPVRVYIEECHRGLVMPAFPFMKDVWLAVGEAERKAIAGAAPVKLADILRRDVTRHARQVRHTGTK